MSWRAFGLGALVGSLVTAPVVCLALEQWLLRGGYYRP